MKVLLIFNPDIAIDYNIADARQGGHDGFSGVDCFRR